MRTRTTALQMHSRQWVGTYAGKGNGDYREELRAALQAITTYLKQFAFFSEMALVRLDGQYGDAAVVAQILQARVPGVTRGRGYQLLEHPQIQSVLAHPPTARLSRGKAHEDVELFDGGWLPLGEGLPHVRVIVARHPAPAAGKEVAVGKRIDEWVYELFLADLDADGFLAEDILDLYQGRGAFEAVLADEDVEEDPDRWCSYTACGQELWQIVCQWVWKLRLWLGQTMQAGEVREIEWAPAQEAPAVLVTVENPAQEYGQWQWSAAFGRGTGRFGAGAFLVHEDGTLCCPAGASLWLSEGRQENAFTQRAGYVASQTDCQHCSLRQQCLGSGAKGNRARRVSAVRRLLPLAASVEHKSVMLGSIRWVDVAGRSLRRGWTAHWRRQRLRCFHWQTLPPASPLPLAPLVRFVHIIAGVGVTAWHATPGGDRPDCASLWQGFPLFLLSTNSGGTDKQPSFFHEVPSPL